MDKVQVVKTAPLFVGLTEHDWKSVAVFDGTPYSSTAQTMEPTALVYISRHDYIKLLEHYSVVSMAVIAELTRRLRSAMDLVRSLAVERVEQRIARLLLKLAAANGKDGDDGMVIEMPLTRQDIADMTGTTVETAIRVLSRFRRMGWVTTRRGRVIITEAGALRDLANSR
jgi:CRP/FNR family transcriptional regulator